ncbi:MAG: LytR/AlgR family response regulator transcription factor [Kordia sp.]|uniref:LytR/AlgR family response regulator transcription factor n=1 Tax=Kordia sp. TaxID=1965332 RepID=UPI00385F85C6
MKTIIIDDNKKSIQVLKLLLSNLCPEVNVIGEASSYTEAVKLIDNNELDLIFLDVNLTEEITGFNVIDNFKNYDFKIIVISAYGDYALQAFDYNVIDFILKPINSQKLINAVHKVSTFIKQKDSAGDARNFLSVQSTYKIDLIKIDDILYLTADGKYTSIKLKDNTEVLSSTNLKVFEEKLMSNNLFFRVHRNRLVNIKNVISVDKRDGFFCVMDNGERIAISRRKKELFLKYIGLKE